MYVSIETAMDGNPKAKHVYVIVKINQNGIYDRLLSTFSITLNDIDKSVNSDVSGILTTNIFDIIISRAEWRTIRPQEVIYNDGKKYVTLTSGWTDLFADKIWMKTKIPCAWSFKSAKGSTKKEHPSIKIKGICKECDAKIIGSIENYSIKCNILLKIVINNYQPDFFHKKRRQLARNRRIQVASNLIDSKTDAIVYVQNKVKSLIQFGDPYPPVLPKNDVLRKAKSEIQEKRLGITGIINFYIYILI